MTPDYIPTAETDGLRGRAEGEGLDLGHRDLVWGQGGVGGQGLGYDVTHSPGVGEKGNPQGFGFDFRVGAVVQSKIRTWGRIQKGWI